ncbi:SMODS domain-containing nucleotidyltransferase [Nocardioides tweenelious]|uniref:SMODS domain-containing nucleotidyltransferase n=1 Tax=Nocardioides tweenelious TaxID=3156607 RepID=UPI003CCE064C
MVSALTRTSLREKPNDAYGASPASFLRPALPDQVDPRARAGLLEKLGIDSQDLLEDLPGAFGTSWASWLVWITESGFRPGLDSAVSDRPADRRGVGEERPVLLSWGCTHDLIRRRVDQCVVRVAFTNFKFEVQPALANDDDSFDSSDTAAKNWKVTKPRLEIPETMGPDQQHGLQTICPPSFFAIYIWYILLHAIRIRRLNF